MLVTAQASTLPQATATGPLNAGVPPSAANSLTTQPRPPWAPRASNSVALLPLGACRRGPPPALCWAAAYEMVDLVTEVVVPGGAAAVRLQVMRTTLVMEEPISSTCLAQIYARNTSCVDSLSSSLQAQEARSPKGWLDQALDTSRQALLDAGSDPSGPPPSSEDKNAVTAVGAGVGVGIGVPLLALVVLLAFRESCLPPPLSRQLLNWKQWLNRDKSAKLQICPTGTGSATDGYQETKLTVQERDPACGLHPAGQSMAASWREEHPLHGSQRQDSAHTAPALALSLDAVQSSSPINASAAGLGRQAASEGATSVSPSFYAQGATAKMFKLSIQESDSRTGFTDDLQQPYLLHGPLCGSNFGQGLLTTAQEPQPDSSPALLAGGDEPLLEVHGQTTTPDQGLHRSATTG
ncbi:hypothetical protein QJQ45_008586 [Haematococcus lacustris]|nr:hypothetical protein QJQ45_008586 [Haematococcus lacustris]